LIYFHGNAEDLGTSHELASHLRQSLNIGVLVPEYPGYGIYKTRGASNVPVECSAELILEDARIIWQYLTSKPRNFFYKEHAEHLSEKEQRINHPLVSSEEIVLFGRSIGSGAAVQLSHYAC